MNDQPYDSDVISEDEAMDRGEGGNVITAPAFQELPNNIEAEQALLGAIFSNNRAMEDAGEFLRPEHFAVSEHGTVYAALQSLIGEGRTVSPVSLIGLFESDEALVALGGKAYLNQLAISAVTIINAPEYARIIYELHMRRELIHVGRGIAERAFNQDMDDPAPLQVEAAERQLSELVGDSAGRQGATREESVNAALSMMERRFNDPDAIIGPTTGLEAVDRILLGLEPTDLLVLAGATSMGKTSLATAIADFNAELHHKTNGASGVSVGFFSKEMSTEQLYQRIASSKTSVPLKQIRTGRYHEGKGAFEKVSMALQRYKNIPLLIDDTGGLTARGIWARARRMKRQHGVGLIVIDQLSHIVPENDKDRPVHALGKITKTIKAMAKDLEVPVILLHQLSRAMMTRDDPRPVLSDLRDSGEIEQDADIVAFVHREEYYLERKGDPVQRENENQEKFLLRMEIHQKRMAAVKGKAEVIVAKYRNGAVGKATVSFQGGYARFANLSTFEDSHPSHPQEDIPL